MTLEQFYEQIAAVPRGTTDMRRPWRCAIREVGDQVFVYFASYDTLDGAVLIGTFSKYALQAGGAEAREHFVKSVSAVATGLVQQQTTNPNVKLKIEERDASGSERFN